MFIADYFSKGGIYDTKYTALKIMNMKASYLSYVFRKWLINFFYY